ncbi:hypothetical protein WA026_012593 [Henosepilachna vigintioctopunctata]|uniref:Uncharacterized protein n=1 Tax=Henosepilachna vigintioctopunctata TaxID=420089 RepID=A0AAW1TXI6_9CUCU
MGKQVTGVSSKLRRNEYYKLNLDPMKRKMDNNMKTTVSSNRMTIFPGFLSYGVKSRFARKEPKENRVNSKHKDILKENLHSLFVSGESSSVRRSSRISKNKSKKYSKCVEKIEYVSNEFPSPESDQPKNSSFTKFEDTTSVTKVLPYSKENKAENHSKSLFKKIISSQAFLNSSSLFKSFFSSKNQEIGNDFNKNLLNKIQINLKTNVVQELRNNIFDEIVKVNAILTGKTEATSIMGSFKKLTKEMSDTEYEVPKIFFSSKEWRYDTPPSQKFNLSLYEESGIQPAILCNNELGRNIYELKKDVNKSLINYINPDNVVVDKRYMEQIAEFDKENRPLRDFPWHEDSRDEKSEKFIFKPANVNPYLLEHLNTVHARPRKTVKRLRYAEALSINEIDIIHKRCCRTSTSTASDTVSLDTPDVRRMSCLTDVSCVDGPCENSSSFSKGTSRRRPLFSHLRDHISEDE